MRELGFGHAAVGKERERDQRYEEEMNTTSPGTSSVPFASNPFVKAEAGAIRQCGQMWSYHINVG